MQYLVSNKTIHLLNLRFQGTKVSHFVLKIQIVHSFVLKNIKLFNNELSEKFNNSSI